jgi:hypothetical protein
MTIFIWNLYEKSFTPYHAQLAPKKFVHRHTQVRQASKVSRTFQDSKVKAMTRFLKKYVLNNTRYYHFSILLFAFFFDNAIKTTLISIYKNKNYQCGLEYAIKAETEYQDARKISHPEEYEDDDDWEDEEEVVVEEEADDEDDE